MSMTLSAIADLLGLEFEGDGDLLIRGIASLDKAAPDKISFITSANYLNALRHCDAGAVILLPSFADDFNGNKVFSSNPYYHYALLSQQFESRGHQAGIHATAVIGEHVVLGADVSIGAHVVIDSYSQIGDRVVIGAGAVIGESVQVGDDCVLDPNVTLYYRVTLGQRCRILANAVIGSDGFGFAPKPGGGWERIAQLGSVIIGDDVVVGASTTIDRGAIDDTLISDGVILDNQIQIGHNVSIGQNTAIAGCVGVAGSASIGRNCAIAGAAGILGHLEIADGVQIMAHSLVRNSVKEPGVYVGGTPLQPISQWRRNSVRFKQLDDMAKRLAALERVSKNNKQ